MQHICFNAGLYCAIARVAPRWTRMSSQYPSLVNSLSYGLNKEVCAPSHSDKLELSSILLFEGQEEREELPSYSTISSVTQDSSFDVFIFIYFFYGHVP